MRRLRGQTLLMFALTLLFLSLTVMVTLGIASRVHDRMEAQIAADTAAYSQAVLTARTFNAFAILNRALVGKMVTMAGVESLISWTGANYGNFTDIPLRIAEAKAAGELDGCDAAVTSLETALTNAKAHADPLFEDLDQAAGEEAAALQGGVQDYQVKLLNSLLGQIAKTKPADVKDPCASCISPRPPIIQGVDPKDMVGKIAKGANPQLDSVKEGDWKSVMEVEAACSLDSATPSLNSVYATMGSIGDPFVNSRANGSGGFATGMTNVYGATGFTGGSSGGGAGFGRLETGGGGAIPTQFKKAESRGSASGYAAWAMDRGGSFSFTLDCGGESKTITGITADAYVYSSEEQQPDDRHVYAGSDTKPPEKRHTMGSCVACDGIWPFFLDYTLTAKDNKDSYKPTPRAVNTPENLYGQPVLYAMVARDYTDISPEQNPWSFRFDFTFADKATFDNGSNQAGSKVLQGKAKGSAKAPYAHQVVLSAGLAYYHRYGHAKEPPNFFNPFWRATLVPPDADASGDAATALDNAGFTQHAKALRLLQQQGYRVTELSP